MIKNIQFMEQLNQYYTTWQEWNCMYEEWARQMDYLPTVC